MARKNLHFLIDMVEYCHKTSVEFKSVKKARLLCLAFLI